MVRVTYCHPVQDVDVVAAWHDVGKSNGAFAVLLSEAKRAPNVNHRQVLAAARSTLSQIRDVEEGLAEKVRARMAALWLRPVQQSNLPDWVSSWHADSGNRELPAASSAAVPRPAIAYGRHRVSSRWFLLARGLAISAIRMALHAAIRTSAFFRRLCTESRFVTPEPNRPPGKLVVSSPRVPRGPSAPRTIAIPTLRGEQRTLA
jgi:hypothetical protein